MYPKISVTIFSLIIFLQNTIIFQVPLKNNVDDTDECHTGAICFDWEHAVWHPVGEGGYWTDPKNFGEVVQ